MRSYIPSTAVRFDRRNPFSLSNGDSVFLAVNSQCEAVRYASTISSAIQVVGLYPIFHLWVPGGSNLPLIEAAEKFAQSKVYIQVVESVSTIEDEATWILGAISSAFERGIPTFIHFLHAGQIREFEKLFGDRQVTATVEFRVSSSPEEAGIQVQRDLASLIHS